MTSPGMRNGEQAVQAAGAAVRILELLAGHEDIGVTEIARATEMSKPRAYRNLRTLVGLGYAVQRDGSDRYARGPKLLALARAVGQAAEDGIIELARPELQALHETFDHSFNLSLVYGDSASIVESLPGKGLVGITVKLGEPLPIHSTAAGKLLLADRLVRDGALPSGKLAKYTEFTITDPADLKEDLEQIARQCWADAPQQVLLGINAVSAPIRDHRGDLIAMLSAMDSIQFIPAKPPAALVKAICRSAEAISAKLAI
ncbi:IclR family transcriptional regulator [Tsuneonella sp. HG222]